MARIVLTDMAGATRSALSNQFGYYHINDVEAGQTYVISVVAKQLLFAPRVVVVQDELGDYDLIMFQ